MRLKQRRRQVGNNVKSQGRGSDYDLSFIGVSCCLGTAGVTLMVRAAGVIGGQLYTGHETLSVDDAGESQNQRYNLCQPPLHAAVQY